MISIIKVFLVVGLWSSEWIHPLRRFEPDPVVKTLQREFWICRLLAFFGLLSLSVGGFGAWLSANTFFCLSIGSIGYLVLRGLASYLFISIIEQAQPYRGYDGGVRYH